MMKLLDIQPNLYKPDLLKFASNKATMVIFWQIFLDFITIAIFVLSMREWFGMMSFLGLEN